MNPKKRTTNVSTRSRQLICVHTLFGLPGKLHKNNRLNYEWRCSRQIIPTCNVLIMYFNHIKQEWKFLDEINVIVLENWVHSKSCENIYRRCKIRHVEYFSAKIHPQTSGAF
jgi:hypothetical protein